MRHGKVTMPTYVAAVQGSESWAFGWWLNEAVAGIERAKCRDKTELVKNTGPRDQRDRATQNYHPPPR